MSRAALGVALASLHLVSVAAAQPPPEEDVEIEAGPPPTPPPAVPATAPTAPATPVPATPPPPTTAPDSAAGAADPVLLELRALRARIDALEAEAQAHRSAQPPPPPEARPSTAPEEPADLGFAERLLGVAAWQLSGYVQAQLELHDDSEDQLGQGGVVLNQDRFLVRRARLRLDTAWEWTALSLEVDGNTVDGPAFGLRRAEATVLWRGPWGPAPDDLGSLLSREKTPIVALTTGLTSIPFGFEMNQSARERAFMERTEGSRAFFPSEPDLGVRLWGGAGFFRYDLAFLNGEPLDERAGRAAVDFNASKDFVGRLGVETDPLEVLHVGGGVSALRGRGFHPGSDATKDAAQWNDVNENGTIDAGEVTAAPGAAATPSLNFDRWAVGADLQVRLQTPLGETLLVGEITVAENLDRGLFPADPVLTGLDLREVSAHVGLVQAITPYALVGFRVDVYDPNGDLLDSRAGEVLPASQTVRTLSPLVGAVLPGRAKLLLQLDHVTDGLARDGVGVPTDLANDRFTTRLQVNL